MKLTFTVLKLIFSNAYQSHPLLCRYVATCRKGWSERYQQAIKNDIAKSSKIVIFVRKSIHASELLEDVDRLQAADVTRWNSQLTMLRSILKAPKDKLEQLDTVSLTSYERKLLQELCTILERFEYATNPVQGEKHVSLTIPVTRGHRRKFLLSTTTSWYQP